MPVLMGLGPSERATPNRWAFIVGITDYVHLGDEPGGDLPGAERDARVTRDVLVQRWGFPAGNVRVLLNCEATLDAFPRAKLLVGRIDGDGVGVWGASSAARCDETRGAAPVSGP